MSTQVNIRLDDVVIEQLDGWTVIRGISRPELIREAIEEWLRRKEDERIGEQYRRAYEEFPETEEEMARAEENARRAVQEEPWEKWW
jgi:metal-responsive CopG/Arc/MetJ family transcriptional regulator